MGFSPHKCQLVRHGWLADLDAVSGFATIPLNNCRLFPADVRKVKIKYNCTAVMLQCKNAQTRRRIQSSCTCTTVEIPRDQEKNNR